MNDPHVEALIYRVIHRDGVHYGNARPLTHDTPEFRVEVDNLRARFEMKVHFATAAEALQIVQPYVTEWQRDADSKRSPGEFALAFEDAEIIDRNPSRKTSMAATISVVPSAVMTVGRGTYPDPPARPAGGITGVGDLRLPAMTIQAHGVVSDPIPPDLDAAKEEIPTTAEEIGQATRQIFVEAPASVVAEARVAKATAHALLTLITDLRINTPEAGEAQVLLERQVESLDNINAILESGGDINAAEKTYLELLGDVLKALLKALNEKSAMKGLLAAAAISLMGVVGVGVNAVAQVLVAGSIVGPEMVSAIQKIVSGLKNKGE